MTRFIIENRIVNPDDISAFTYEGFEHEPTLGESNYPHSSNSRKVSGNDGRSWREGILDLKGKE